MCLTFALFKCLCVNRKEWWKIDVKNFGWYAQEEEDEETQEEETQEEITLEKKKLPAGLKAYLDKKKKGGTSKKSGTSKSKPDFLDIDKDGDKKESMKKAFKELKSKKK